MNFLCNSLILAIVVGVGVGSFIEFDNGECNGWIKSNMAKAAMHIYKTHCLILSAYFLLNHQQKTFVNRHKCFEIKN